MAGRLATEEGGAVTGSRPIAFSLVLGWTLVVLTALAVLAPGAARSTTLGPAGPLALGQSYTGQLESSGDRDRYYFYVTSPEPAQVAITLENLGGGEEFSSVSVTIADAAATPLGAYAYSVGRGEAGVASATVGPQKYMVEVAPHESFGDTYRITTSGGPGAFGPYAAIAARCAQARSAVARRGNRVSRDRAKLQRVTARLRRSRFGTPRSRRGARVAYGKVKSRLKRDRRGLRAARRAQSPWCSIPQ